MRWWTFGYHKVRGISWVDENLLASQKGLCSMELVTYESVKPTDTDEERVKLVGGTYLSNCRMSGPRRPSQNFHSQSRRSIPDTCRILNISLNRDVQWLLKTAQLFTPNDDEPITTSTQRGGGGPLVAFTINKSVEFYTTRRACAFMYIMCVNTHTREL
jgi:hypothetical protein